MEIELKFPLMNHNEVFKKLLESISQPVVNNQKDTYYNHPSRDFLSAKPVIEWLRIRETPRGCSINYKNWHDPKGEGIYCDEYETKISDSKVVEDILISLGFTKIVVVNKSRSSWLIDGVELSIDNVQGLGFFIEVEAKKDFGSVEEAKKHLLLLLKSVGANLGKQDFRGYPMMLIENDKS